MTKIDIDLTFQDKIDSLIKGWDLGDPESIMALKTLAYSKIFELTRKLRKKSQESPVICHFTTSDMAHEVWLRLASADCQVSISSRREFYSYIQQTMHTFMLDEQKKYSRKKRDGNILYIGLLEDTPSNESQYSDANKMEENVSLTKLIERLSIEHPDVAIVVKYKWYLGLVSKEISSVLDMAESVVNSNIKFAKMWLRSKMEFELSI